jgi:hypothetical protein
MWSTGTMCVHHWKIETPERETSRGECLKCGENREFKSWMQEYSDKDIPLVGSAERAWLKTVGRRTIGR